MNESEGPEARTPSFPAYRHTVDAMIRHASTTRGEQEFVILDQERLTFADSGERSAEFARGLLAAGIDVDHVCGGVVACSTCHIYVSKGLDSAPEAIEEEEDQLDFAPALRDDSRLACQCVPDGSVDVEVELPDWNRNEVSEEPH